MRCFQPVSRRPRWFTDHSRGKRIEHRRGRTSTSVWQGGRGSCRQPLDPLGSEGTGKIFRLQCLHFLNERLFAMGSYYIPWERELNFTYETKERLFSHVSGLVQEFIKDYRAANPSMWVVWEDYAAHRNPFFTYDRFLHGLRDYSRKTSSDKEQ